VNGEAGRDFDTGLTRAEWLLLLVLAAVQFTHSMDFMVMLPLGPKCREEFSLTPGWFAVLVGSYGFSASVAGLLAARFIDRFDRKTALLVTYAGFTAGTLLCAVALDFWWLLLARCVAGTFGGVVGALILVIIGDVFPELRRGRATGVVMTAFSVASIAGLPAGIMLGNRLGVRAPFGVLGVLAGAVWVVAWRVLPPLRGHLGHRGQSAAETWAILVRLEHLRAYAFMIVLVLGSFTISPHLSDFLVHNVGRDKDDLAYVYLCGGLLTFVTLPRVGRLADRFGKRPVFRVLAWCTALTLLLLTNLPPASLLPVLAVTTLYFFVTSGRWVPAMALITSSARARYRGGFMSVNASVQQMACGLASVLAGAVVSEGAGGRLTGYPLAGLIAAGSTAVSIFLSAGLRPAEETAVDAPGEIEEPAAEPAPAARPGHAGQEPLV
jgi:predicted MFS family arabinose efflux permease